MSQPLPIDIEEKSARVQLKIRHRIEYITKFLCAEILELDKRSLETIETFIESDSGLEYTFDEYHRGDLSTNQDTDDSGEETFYIGFYIDEVLRQVGIVVHDIDANLLRIEGFGEYLCEHIPRKWLFNDFESDAITARDAYRSKHNVLGPKQISQIRKQALAKLTAEEKKALGL